MVELNTTRYQGVCLYMRFASRLIALALGLAALPAFAASLLITNGGFEEGITGWRSFWSREAQAGALEFDHQIVHGGATSARLTHRGTQDWSLETATRLGVEAGDLFSFEAFFKVQGEGRAVLCVSTWDAQGKVIDWSFGEHSVSATKDWTRVRSWFVTPAGVVQIQPRVIGYGPATVWLDDVSLQRMSNLRDVRRANLPSSLSLTNTRLVVSFDTSNATFSATDLRTHRQWTQRAPSSEVVVLNAQSQPNHFQATLLHAPSGQDLTLEVLLEAEQPEFTLELTGQGELPSALKYPAPFSSQRGDYLVVPMNEGISYPVEDQSIEPFRLVAYGGHGICMAFWGATDGVAGYGAILETPDDASIQIRRTDGLLTIAPEWEAQKGQFGYPRRLRYTFFDQGGHVAIAKRYRAHAQKIGLFKTLEEKRRVNTNVDLLIGAVNVWNWDSPPVELAKEMQAAGIERILWSRGGSAEQLRALNDLKVLTSRYDIYQDVMAPSNFPSLGGTHGDWTTAAWPKDIVRRDDGDWLRGWGIQGRQGEWHYCGVTCDKRAPDYARERIPAELATRPYRCRFIDTTTAAPWHECYHPDHPMTRTESREWKMKLLDYVSADMKLVTGCETGHDAAVPFLHYFEGMLSLGPYRVPDAGRNMQRILAEVPDQVAKFQLGETYRLPLWELVYHECVVAQWYWGDYNNKLPSLWNKRDLFNVLYATPPMFLFNRQFWKENQARFVKSYRNTCPYVRAVGYVEMTDHRFLTPDRTVQQTTFANGGTITVNFGSKPYTPTGGGGVLAAGAFRAAGLNVDQP